MAEIEPGTIMTEEQFWDSEDGDALIGFLASEENNPQYLPNPQRQAEIALTKGFKPTYLKALFAHMARGKSYGTFHRAGKEIIPPSRLRKFEKEIPEWSWVMEMGEYARKSKMEDWVIDHIEGNVEKGANGTVLISAMKAVFDSWNPEKKSISLNQHQHILPTGEDGKIQLQFTVKSSAKVLENDETITIEP